MYFQLQVVCILAIVAVALSAPDTKTEEQLKAIVEKCKTKVNATDEDVATLDMDSEEMPKTKTQFCLNACFYKETGVMTADNKVNLDKIIEELEPIKNISTEFYDEYSKGVKECVKKLSPVNETDECKAVKNYIECTETYIKQAMKTKK